MCPRPRVLILFAFLLIMVGNGSSNATDSDLIPREDPFNVRSFHATSDERWIGNAISYGPHRDGQHPGVIAPSADEMREDLNLMIPHWNLLRVYGSSGFAETLLTVIRDEQMDMNVMLGAWIALDDPAGNRAEVDAAIRLTAAFPDIILAVSVGNETQVSWSAHRSPLNNLIEHVRRVRANVTVPVTVADDYNYWNKEQSRLLSSEIDFITMHAHPMWNGIQLAEALDWTRDQMDAVHAIHPGHTVVLGETGWATSVHDQGEQARLIKGQAGEKEQKQFYDAVRAWAAEKRQTVFFFEAFDENWKGGPHPAEVEKHWGVFHTDRSPKAAMVSAEGK